MSCSPFVYGGSVFVPCFAFQYFISFLICLSSWTLPLNFLPLWLIWFYSVLIYLPCIGRNYEIIITFSKTFLVGIWEPWYQVGVGVQPTP